jgi:hypothetical protein
MSRGRYVYWTKVQIQHSFREHLGCKRHNTQGSSFSREIRIPAAFSGVTDHLHFLLKPVYLAVLFMELLEQHRRYRGSRQCTKNKIGPFSSRSRAP